MEYTLTLEDKKDERHRIELEELVFYPEKITGQGKSYILSGSAEVDGELYPVFEMEICLMEDGDTTQPLSLLEAEWDWYDFIF